MRLSTKLLVGTALVVGSATAYSLQNQDRRAFLSKSVATTASAAGILKFQQTAVAADADGFITTDSGLKYKVVKEGNGTVPPPGALVKTHYTGWLDDFNSDKKFDSSKDRNRPFQFKVGTGQVIRGWDEAFGSMSVGEERLIIIPSNLGYGSRGAGGIIPGGATLYFDVELLGIL
eukprot:CAMPEP_0202481084 /NCGR_PEP_ID=MMETSP1361-20130828/821_1 /ASSEMBLY_ACC=CAM_ASM_000849 /TAXON_ID=210615 /ORGANISM="Staurosira complex sp., Strain CCMP2646" /LENGTH=174 /DNA_ID=CAMNT_0049108577 /DNA_START=32 /DNA_END=556 /DNA_ORIENTATION=+